jgi:hypothetical protein
MKQITVLAMCYDLCIAGRRLDRQGRLPGEKVAAIEIEADIA